jgi:outer membrane protein
MKKIVVAALLLLTVAFTSNTFAQKQYKFGHIDSNQLLSQMPERAKAKTDLEKYAKQLESTLTGMQSEFERKYNEYVASADSLSNLIRQTKEAELGEMQQRIQTFQQTAQQDLAQKENELLQPIVQKAKDAIKEVSEENNFTYVFDVGTGVLLYFSDDSIDILPLVKTKLGIIK